MTMENFKMELINKIQTALEIKAMFSLKTER